MEENKILYALCLMWNQYCGEDGHKSMSAGEDASHILMERNLIKDAFSVVSSNDLDKLYEIKT